MYTYKKSERLCNKKLTENLFKYGKSISEDFFRIVYINVESQDVILRSQIIVPKRNITKAVDRNFIKRQIRESYRKNKHIIIDFLKKHNKSLNFAIIFQESSAKKTILVEEKIKEIFNRLVITI
tara:strand:- start:57 stop:428 length:372 start_codon:yes stop_codon:yes gene_type:complete